MTWGNSKVFRQFIADAVRNTAPFNLAGDTSRVALYNNTITPDNDVSAANSAYGSGVWSSAAGPQVYHPGEWAQGGVALTATAVNTGTADVVFWSANMVSSGSGATMSNVYGCLVYDDSLVSPVADQGVCYTYFGGAHNVTVGTFSIVWNPNGIWRMSFP